MFRVTWSLALVATIVACGGGDDAPAEDGSTGVGGGTEGTTTSEPTTTATTSVDESTGGDGSSGGSTTGPLPEPLPPLDAAPLSTDVTIVPTHVIDAPPLLDPREVDQRQQMLDEGYGDFDLEAGEPVMEVTPDGMPAPAPGPGAAMIGRFAHLADSQLVDDESPTRVVLIDNPVVDGGFRSQESHSCHVLNAAVRTLNAVHAATALDFVVLGGDNADSAQRNEVEWFLSIMDGADFVHCDSGDDDDPEPGPDNDVKDPFAPVGLEVPWIWVSGNHDVHVQGNFAIDSMADAAVGTAVGNATRDWSQPGGPVFNGPVVADDRRELLDGPSLLTAVSLSGDSHGITKEIAGAGRATYAWDSPAGGLRIVVVDSTNDIGGSDGVIRQGQVDDDIRPLLDQAEADGVLAMVATHHASSSLTDNGGLPGVEPYPDALTEEDWQAFLGEYPNVIAHLCGHSHENRVRYVEPMAGNPYWEVTTSAIIDWPHQMRLVELHDQDNGWLSLRLVSVDYATDDDTFGAQGRALGIADFTGGWVGDGYGEPTDRNVELWLPAP